MPNPSILSSCDWLTISQIENGASLLTAGSFDHHWRHEQKPR
jgi:hypothetical protein